MAYLRKSLGIDSRGCQPMKASNSKILTGQGNYFLNMLFLPQCVPRMIDCSVTWQCQSRQALPSCLWKQPWLHELVFLHNRDESSRANLQSRIHFVTSGPCEECFCHGHAIKPARSAQTYTTNGATLKELIESSVQTNPAVINRAVYQVMMSASVKGLFRLAFRWIKVPRSPCVACSMTMCNMSFSVKQVW